MLSREDELLCDHPDTIVRNRHHSKEAQHLSMEGRKYRKYNDKRDRGEELPVLDDVWHINPLAGERLHVADQPPASATMGNSNSSFKLATVRFHLTPISARVSGLTRGAMRQRMRSAGFESEGERAVVPDLHLSRARIRSHGRRIAARTESYGRGDGQCRDLRDISCRRIGPKGRPRVGDAGRTCIDVLIRPPWPTLEYNYILAYAATFPKDIKDLATVGISVTWLQAQLERRSAASVMILDAGFQDVSPR
jgi:hypothetical protein